MRRIGVLMNLGVDDLGAPAIRKPLWAAASSNACVLISGGHYGRRSRVPRKKVRTRGYSDQRRKWKFSLPTWSRPHIVHCDHVAAARFLVANGGFCWKRRQLRRRDISDSVCL